MYRPFNRLANADFCSRFPLQQEIPEELDTEVIKNINFSKNIPLDSKMIAEAVEQDEFLSRINWFMHNGWPERIEKRFVSVFANQQELELVDGCLLYGGRVIVPQIYHKQVLKLLHGNHAGIVKMNQLARRMVYWFGINADIESYVNRCNACNGMAIVHKSAESSKWTPTVKPFSRIHVDFFFFEHRTYLLIVDSFSKWIEIEHMKQGTDSNRVLKKLVSYFARFGLPDVLVSDNGPPFNSHNFVNFVERQGIKIMKSPPYNPSSNGQAERLVRTVIEVLKSFLLEPEVAELDLEDQINLFLFNFRNNNLTSDGLLPSEKIFKYKPKTILDLINPRKHYKNHLYRTQSNDETSTKHPSGRIPRHSNEAINELMAGEEVWYKNHNPHLQARWIKATCINRYSPHTF